MAIFLCLLLIMIVQLFPLIDDIVTGKESESDIVTQVQLFGWRGVPALIGISALQVIIPIIPAAVTGVIAGLSYGIYWGSLIYLSGIAIGNLFIVVSIRQLRNLITLKTKHNSEQISNHKKTLSVEQLNKLKRPEIVVFFLFMIPLLSGVGPYLFARTNIPLGKYLIAVIAGSIPFTIVYVFLGDHISRGNHTMAIAMAVILTIILLIILLFRKRIMEKIMSESNN